MALTLIYRAFATLLSWIVLRTRSGSAKEIEILVLRHQLVGFQKSARAFDLAGIGTPA